MGKISKLRLRWNTSQGVSRKELEALGGGCKPMEQGSSGQDPLEESRKTIESGSGAKILHLQD